MTVVDLKALVKFLVVIENGDDRNRPSQYITRPQLIQRLCDCKRPWTEYFETRQSDSDASQSDDTDDSEDESESG